MNDRHFSLILLTIVGIYTVLCLRIEVSPFSDPLGPRFLPLLLVFILAPLLFFQLLHPRQTRPQGSGSLAKNLQLLAILLLYLASWDFLGFLLATTLCLYLAARHFQCSWMQGLMVALIVSVICYGLFHFGLNIPLPLGEIYIFAKG